MSSTPNAVIVGTGHGGVQVASSLREHGFDGRITMIGEEPDLPYHRPPLSKSYVVSDSAELDPLRGAEYFSNNDIELIVGRLVTSVCPSEQVLRLNSGSRVRYDHLILATGSRNRVIPVEGADLDGVFGLRTAAEAREIRDRLTSTNDIVVIGGGFIGMEFAAAVAAAGKNVTLLVAAPRTMARAVSAEVSAFLEAKQHASGVTVITSSSVTRFEGLNGKIATVVGGDGERFAADLVLVGIGAQAESELAAEAGLAVGSHGADGVLVDQYLVTSHPNISAIGDCARFPLGNATVRLESVQNAVDQARSVAMRLTGTALPYDRVPWFWSNQGKVKVQIAGLRTGIDKTVTRGDVSSGKFSLFGYCGTDLVAVESINQPGDHMAARRILETRASLTYDQAADRAFRLKDACRQTDPVESN